MPISHLHFVPLHRWVLLLFFPQITVICNHGYYYLHICLTNIILNHATTLECHKKTIYCFIDVLKHANKHKCRNKTIYCFIDVFKNATKHECRNKTIDCFIYVFNHATKHKCRNKTIFFTVLLMFLCTQLIINAIKNYLLFYWCFSAWN